MQIPFVTVITDLTTIHPAWFHRDVTLCFAPTELAGMMAVGRGLSDEQVRVHGLPLRPAFSHLPERGPSLRTRLGVDAELPAVLVYGGGAGYHKVMSTVESLDARLSRDASPAGQLIIVTGRTGTLQPNIAARRWSVPVKVEGFVPNMHEWMTASDCIISKAGPGTISESMVCGLPIVLNGYIPGQEAGNVPYVLNNKIGAYSEEPRGIAAIIGRWFGQGAAERETMAARSVQLSKPCATFDIVTDIAGLI